jgi:hypothetical protein
VTSNVAVTVTQNGTATTAVSDSTTAAIVRVAGYVTGAGDTITVSMVNKSAPTTAGSYVGRLQIKDTVSGTVTSVKAGAVSDSSTTSVGFGAAADSVTSGTTPGFSMWTFPQSSAQYVAADFFVYIESKVAGVMPVAGTYTFTILTQAYSGGALNTIQPAAVDVSVVVSALATASKTVHSSSTAIMGELAHTGGTVDSTVAASKTASNVAAATIVVTLLNVSGGSAQESITATIDKGVIGLSGGTSGRSVTPVTAAGANTFKVYADGTAGVATIKFSTPSYTFPAKTITFYGDAATIKAGAISSVVGNTSTLGVWGTAADSSATDLGAGTALYAYSSDTKVISNYGTACDWNATTKYAECNLTGVTDGTASITLRDAATVAASTVASNAVSVRSAVNKVATSYKVTTDKSSYAPGALASIIVTVYDADGKVMPAGTYTNLFTTGGITPTLAVTAVSGGGTLSSASVTTAANPVASALLPVVSLDPIMQYYVNMPTTGGTMGLVHKGGSSVPTAAQVTTTTPVTITDNAAAALAAVTALATTVASLKTLITTLTNLVLKIQKKVKA